jgi:hypothetical protein
VFARWIGIRGSQVRCAVIHIFFALQVLFQFDGSAGAASSRRKNDFAALFSWFAGKWTILSRCGIFLSVRRFNCHPLQGDMP